MPRHPGEGNDTRTALITALLVLVLVCALALPGCGTGGDGKAGAGKIKASASRYLTGDGRELARGKTEGSTVYEISASLDTGSNVVSGTENVLYTNRSDGAITDVVFRVYAAGAGTGSSRRSTTVTGFKVGNETASGKLDGTVLTVDLPKALESRDSAYISFSFEEPVPRVGADGTAGLFAHDSSSFDLGNFIPTVVPYGGGRWDERQTSDYTDVNYFDASFYDVSIRAPEGFVVAATGIEAAGGGGTHRFVAGPVRDFDVQVSSKYRSVTRKVGPTTVTSYYYRGQERGGGKALDSGCRALEEYSSRIGPYPYTRLNVCEGLLSDYGMEYTGQIIVSRDMYSDPADEDALEITVAHEVLHEWFALGIGSDAIDNAWLDESLVSFGEVLYSRWEHGEQAAADALAELADLYTSSREEDIADAPVEQPAGAFLDGDQYTAMVYGKGAVFYDALYKMMGEAAFTKSLSEYYRGKVFGNATTADLLAAFRANSTDPAAVDRLYQRWIKETHGDEDVPAG